MPPRAVTAVALLTAALAGPVAAQPPAPGPAYPAPGMAPTAMPPGGYPAYPPGQGYPANGPGLPTDSLGAAPGGTSDPFGPNCWAGVEYLFYRAKPGSVSAPLATGAPAGSLALNGGPTTRLLLGGGLQDYRFQDLSGVRVFAGGWFTDSQTFGAEGSFFILPEKHSVVGPVVATGFLPVLSRPFFDPTINRQNVKLLSYPGLFTGGITSDYGSRFWGAELASVLRCWEQGSCTVDGIVGFKFLDLEESLQINDFSNSTGGTINFAGRTFGNTSRTYTEDRVSTASRFYGGVFGLRGSWHLQAFTFGLTAKVSAGEMYETVRLDGSTTLTGPFPTPLTAGGGFFSTTNNVGKYTQSNFAVIPEGSFNFSAQVTRHLTVNLGYTYLYIDKVVRAGDQLPTTIPPNQVVTSPSFGSGFRTGQLPVTMEQTSYWIHGLNVGVSYGF
jgi:hypothetical protein